eukprot:TRINITY_DN93703_c0_g1_i1.p1 TRINITY_DN93703_c0_g1~~TRINITY_DN93703_c0_g1_i1.p1  ORF type:complete len:595 (-),score=163.17 TRINITY_DN93703_c0_g1_i1:61-1845(-)
MSGNAQDGSSEYVEGRLLDGFLLLAAGGSSSPEGVVTVNLSSLQIVDVADEDLAFFGHLDRLDVSDNHLGYEHILEQLSRVPRLSTLNLACNSISSLQVQPGFLRHLEVLDLSFNGLHGDVLSQLARLPSLITLNLSSNCISSVPPEEELCGLQALEELILDANDLVQFIQWRALDALPRLRKLSLSANRVKRLKDDAPDTASGTAMSYFSSLEELDLSNNEITGVNCLPVVPFFQCLKVIRLSDNPCSRGSGPMHIANVQVVFEESKPFYMKGNGAFQGKAALAKMNQPKLRLDRRSMRKVQSERQLGQEHPRSMSQLGHLDEEANQLLVQMSGELIADVKARAQSQARVSSAPASQQIVPVKAAEGEGILNDELSEEELDQIFQERRATIEARFEEPTDEPASFMRQPEEPGTKEKLSMLMRQMRAQQEEEQMGATQNMSAASPKVAPSSLFLTGIGEDAAETSLQRSSKTRLAPVASEKRISPSRDSPSVRSQTPEAEVSPAAAFQAMLGNTSPGNASEGVHLPPISGGQQRQSSKPLGTSPYQTGASAPLPDLRPANAGGKPKAPMADAGVREAIRALRAATMSEFAVAA